MVEHKIRLLMQHLHKAGYRVSRHGCDALVFRGNTYVASIHIYPLAGMVTVKRYVLNPESRRHALNIARLIEDALPGCRVLLGETRVLREGEP